MSRCFTSGAHHPLLQLSGRLYTNYVSWLVGTATSAEIPESLRKQPQRERQEEDRLENLMDDIEESGSQPGDDELTEIHSDICRACRKDLETRLHLLSECPGTAQLRRKFEQELSHRFPRKHAEFCSIPSSDRWLWILAGGLQPLPVEKPNHRTHPRATAFLKGHRIDLPRDAKDPRKETRVEDCLEPFVIYQRLKEDLLHDDPPDTLNVYTDGSHKRNPSTSGSAAIIYRTSDKPVVLSSHTGSTTNNYSELHAILLLLDWLRGRDIKDTTVNIFTDSTYVQDRLTDPMIPEQNFYIIQEIIHKATALCNGPRHLRFVLHKIPAHLGEKSLHRYSIAENAAVDTAAKQARDSPQPFVSVNCTRQQTFHLCAQLLMKISKLLTPPLGPSSDRLSLSATANRDPDSSGLETHQPLA